MSAIAFDTHAFDRRLTAASMPEPQSEVLTDQQAKLIDKKLSTKTDLATTERTLTTDIGGLRRETKTDIAELKADIIKWMFGTIGFQTAVILGAVMALARVDHS